METMIDKYTYRLEWSDEDNCHVARCIEFPSLGAYGKTAEKALKEIRAVVAASIAWMQGEKQGHILNIKCLRHNCWTSRKGIYRGWF
jgi:predicted RNase H-like HicB family nuclease